MSQPNVPQLLSQLQNLVAVAQATDTSANTLPKGLPRALSSPKQDPMGFLLQVAAMLFGAGFLESKLNTLLRKLAGTGQEPSALEGYLKDALYRLCVAGFGEQLIPAAFSSPGYTLPVRLLDLFELLRLDPASEAGRVALPPLVRDFITLVVRQPGVAHTFAQWPYLRVTGDLTGQSVTFTFAPANGPQPAPTRLVDLFADIIYSPEFRLLDPTRLALDVLDWVLGVTADTQSPKGQERAQWLSQVVDTLSGEEEPEALFDFSTPALAASRAAVASRQGGLTLESGCEPENRLIPAAAVRVPSVAGTVEPDLALAYTTLLADHLTTSDAPQAAPEAPVRDAVSTGLAKGLLLLIARDTILTPQVWTLLVLSRLLNGGYSPPDFARYLAQGINAVDFADLLAGVRPLLTTAVQLIVKTAVAYLSGELLKQVQRLLAPLLTRLASEQAAAYIATLESLSPVSVSSVLSALF
jgi:hypothetical protein